MHHYHYKLCAHYFDRIGRADCSYHLDTYFQQLRLLVSLLHELVAIPITFIICLVLQQEMRFFYPRVGTFGCIIKTKVTIVLFNKVTYHDTSSLFFWLNLLAPFLCPCPTLIFVGVENAFIMIYPNQLLFTRVRVCDHSSCIARLWQLCMSICNINIF